MTASTLAYITPADIRRNTRGMNPEEKAAYIDLETTWPIPRRIEGSLWLYESESLEHPGEMHVTDTLHKTCTCTAGQKGQLCYHYHRCRRLEMFGPVRTVLREAVADRQFTRMLVYERESGTSAVDTIPPEDLRNVEEWREWRQTRRTA